MMDNPINKRSKSKEAYLLIDHKNSPGISEEFARQHNLPGPAVGAGKVFESAISVCHCCTGDIILNPNRSRPREWCMKHDAYLCDGCALVRRLTGDCVPIKERMARIYKRLTGRNL